MDTENPRPPVTQTHGRTAHRGRFAPSPTGPLHFGSLIAAVGSFLQARTCSGMWCLRIDDIDTPRIVPGSVDAILGALESFGLYWDGPVMYQSQRTSHYQTVLEKLLDLGLAYPCTCSRQTIAQLGQRGPGGLIYPGLCRTRTGSPTRAASVRLRTNHRPIAFTDTIRGNICQDLEGEVGDFVIRRADGIFAYHLATVVDDAAQGITHVVRGSDLLDSTARQIYLQRLLGLTTPRYSHLPLVLDKHGDKLSKQTHAPPLDPKRPVSAILMALQFLGQSPPQELAQERLDTIWDWATSHWNPAHIPKREAAGDCRTIRPRECHPATRS